MVGSLLRTRSSRSFQDLTSFVGSKASGSPAKPLTRRNSVPRTAGLLLLLAACLFVLTLGPGLPTLDLSPKKAGPLEEEPLHRKLARESLASLMEGRGALERNQTDSLGREDVDVEQNSEEVDSWSRKSEVEVAPLEEPIVVYPNLFEAREEYLARGQEDPGLIVSRVALWEEPLQGVGDLASCKKLDGIIPDTEPLPPETGYLLVDANGGLNQQRISVCNAVAVARLLNVTLVIPRFLFDSVWLDGSQFHNVFNLDHFIETLAPDVRVVTEAPVEDWSTVPEASYSLHVPKYSPPEYYLEHGPPLLRHYGVLKLAAYMHGLGFHGIPQQLQRLRCRANFEALKLVPGLQAFGDLLVERLRTKAGGRFLALHLRFEKDMVADTCCDYGGGPEEQADLDAYRKSHFPGMATKYNEMTDAAALRKEGHCPLTPEELALLLAGLGYGNETVVYIAAGKVYGGTRRMAAFKGLFPLSFTKQALASTDELAPFAEHTSQLAAIDTYVAEHSDVFAYGHTGSNFPKIVSGLRLYSGQRRTIAPYKKKLASLFERAKGQPVSWEHFSQKVRGMHPPRKLSKEFGKNLYREPIPDCVCQIAVDGGTESSGG